MLSTFPIYLKICMGVAHKGNASSSLVLWGPGPHTGPLGHHTQLCRHKHIRCFVSQRTGLWMVCRVRSSCIPQQRIQILMHKGKAYLIRKKISKYCQKYFCSFLWFCSCFCHHQNVLQMQPLKSTPLYHLSDLKSEVQVGSCTRCLPGCDQPGLWSCGPRESTLSRCVVPWRPGCWLADRGAALCSKGHRHL